MNNTSTIFIVEDEPIYRRLLEYSLRLNPDYQLEIYEKGKDCLSRLLTKQPDIIILDYGLPDMKGIDILKYVKDNYPDIEIIVLSAQRNVSIAVQLLQEGAYDYINKDDQTSAELKDRLLNTVRNILKKQRLKKEKQQLTQEVSRLKQKLSQKYSFSKLLKGNSEALMQVFKMLEKAAKTSITVSITGETGTGKELAAKSIHYNSKRKDKSFVAVNVTAIPKDLLESELFGHEKGSFTGAVNRRIGKFEQANLGTLFLDEIGEMDMNMQTKLLRVLQEREIIRVGSNDVIKINTRIIVATHRNLQEMVIKGSFRQDLYYRLLGLPIVMPPLRKRGHDILILAVFFLKKFTEDNDMEDLTFSATARAKLVNYSYPGNIRELKAIVELAAVLSNGSVIEREDIHFSTQIAIKSLLDEEMTLKEYNQKIVNAYLDKYDNNVILVAKKLGIGKSTIYRMLKEMETYKES